MSEYGGSGNLQAVSMANATTGTAVGSFGTILRRIVP